MYSTTKGKDVFNVLDNFFKLNELDWRKLIGCTTDGAPSMLGRKSGFQAHVKAVSPNVTSVHCFIHRFALRSHQPLKSVISRTKLHRRRVYFKTGGVYPEVRSVEEERGEQEIWNV